jgi:hypothetical protein
MRRGALFALFSTALRAQQASLEGTVTDKLTHEPLGGVHIMLITGVTNSGTGVYGARSDRTGHFSIASVRPGTYMLLCERSGYLQVQLKDAGIPNITLKPGQQLKDYKIDLTPRAILSGRVLDENGDPIQGATIESVMLPPESSSLFQMINEAMARERGTDDRGEFRLTVPPGKYYVKATAHDLPERRNDGTTPPPYSPTYYPSTAAKARATVVEAVGGRDTSGIEIRMTRQQGLSITGIVTGIPDGNARPNVQLKQVREGSNRFSNMHDRNVGADGKFAFAGLEPATYRVWATLRNDTGALFSKTVDIKLDAADPPPVTLMLQPGAEGSGTLVIEGDPPDTAAEKRTVRLEAADDTTHGGADGLTDRQNNFQIPGVGGGKYRVHVSPLPENAYVKSIEMDGKPGAENLFDIADGSRAARIQVIVSRSGAQIAGRVLDSEGNRLLTPLAVVGLLRSAEDEEVNSGEVTPDGRYSMKGVPPGKYRLIAVNPFEMLNVDDESSWFKRLFGRGEEIDLKAGDRVTKDVKLLSKEEANAKK